MKIKLLGISSKKHIEKQVNICASAGKLSRMNGTVFDAVKSMEDYDKALKFIKRVIAMGHTSTIDHDYMVFALSEVSPVVEQTIIAERFASFTVKSRREVDFSTVKYYIPNFRDENREILEQNSFLQKKYKKHMQSLFASYKKLVDAGIPKEDARFVLPYSYHSEIIMGLDATSLVRMIINLTKKEYSQIAELKELGEKLYEIAKIRAPYITTLVENESENINSKTKEMLDNLIEDQSYKLLEHPKLLSYTKDLDKVIFTNAISRIYGKDYASSEKIYEDKVKGNDELSSKLMKTIFNENGYEDLKMVNMRFEFGVPFAILTHYTRHRRLALSIPSFLNQNYLTNFITPPKIKSSNFNDVYEEIFKTNKEVYDDFASYGVCKADLVYFTLSGHAINVIVNFDGEAFRWICRLRECTKAQWCIRLCVTKMHEEIKKVCKYYAENLGPDCVTKHFCGEGKESCGRIEGILKSIGDENAKR